MVIVMMMMVIMVTIVMMVICDDNIAVLTLIKAMGLMIRMTIMMLSSSTRIW